MSYKIVYGPDPRRKVGRSGAVLAITALLTAVLLLSIFPEVGQQLREFILPRQQSESIAEAFGLFQDALEQGSGVGEAVTVFCREIIENANLPD